MQSTFDKSYLSFKNPEIKYKIDNFYVQVQGTASFANTGVFVEFRFDLLQPTIQKMD